eukprot:TRINITY_DN18740_c0_g1_i1.p1 TRINITY_DN18740_c0_g1~~TRINITY_DN18740_c0_g1_i1.p1  ORF type:complete len:268 (+),score=36.75 TRINITY_DN18740_c0_g1_i1:1354-2157(+)
MVPLLMYTYHRQPAWRVPIAILIAFLLVGPIILVFLVPVSWAGNLINRAVGGNGATVPGAPPPLMSFLDSNWTADYIWFVNFFVIYDGNNAGQSATIPPLPVPFTLPPPPPISPTGTATNGHYDQKSHSANGVAPPGVERVARVSPKQSDRQKGSPSQARTSPGTTSQVVSSASGGGSDSTAGLPSSQVGLGHTVGSTDDPGTSESKLGFGVPPLLSPPSRGGRPLRPGKKRPKGKRRKGGHKKSSSLTTGSATPPSSSKEFARKGP